MTTAKIIQSGFFCPSLFKDAHTLAQRCDRCQRTGSIYQRHEMPLQNIQEIKVF